MSAALLQSVLTVTGSLISHNNSRCCILSSVKLQAQASGGHASTPPKATAIGILSRAIDRLQPFLRPGHTTQLEAEWDLVAGKLDRLLDIVGRFPNAQVAHH